MRLMRHIMTHRLLILAATLVLAACASSSQADRERYATLVVDNDSTLTVNIYSVRGGGRGVRLDQVAALRTTRIPLRRHMVSTSGQFQVMIDPVGSTRTYTSDIIVINEGDEIRLRVSALIH